MSIKKLNKWIFTSFNTKLISTYCGADKDIWKWYANLEQQYGQKSANNSINQQITYHNALHTPRNFKDLPNQINQWEIIMAQAKQKGVPEAT